MSDDQANTGTRAAAESPYEPLLPAKLPPELEALGRDEVRAIFEEALIIAIRWTKSPERGRQLLSDLYTRLTTTQRWDPTQAPLRVFVIQRLRHLLKHAPDDSRVTARERKAMEGFHQEMRPERVASTEEMHLETAYYEERRAKYARRLSRLVERGARLELPTRIIDAYREHDFKTRAELAEHLGVQTTEVYRAVETLRYHYDKIIADERAEEGTEKKP